MTTEEVVRRVIVRVAELPDRDSPDDWPEAMLVTDEELRRILTEELAAFVLQPVGELPVEVMAFAEFGRAMYAAGYRYGIDALENAYVGWKLARSLTPQAVPGSEREAFEAALNNDVMFKLDHKDAIRFEDYAKHCMWLGWQARASNQAPHGAAPDSLSASPVVPRKSDSHPAWRPIESAPDGVLVVLWHVGQYNAFPCIGSTQPNHPVLVARGWRNTSARSVTPTHWMPLPATPGVATPKPESETVALLREAKEALVLGRSTLEGREFCDEVIARIDAALTTKERPDDLFRDRDGSKS